MENCEKFLSSSLPFWDTLTQSQKKLVLENTQKVQFEKSQPINNKNDSCIGIVILKQGEFRISLQAENGRDVTLFRLKAGDVWMMSYNCPLSLTGLDIMMTAQQSSQAYIISPQVIDSLMSNVNVQLFVYKTSSEKYEEVLWTLQQYIFCDIDKRVALLLYDEAVSTGKIELSLTHEDIAKYIGSVREVVSRTLKFLQQEKFISLARGKISILDLEKIKNSYVI